MPMNRQEKQFYNTAFTRIKELEDKIKVLENKVLAHQTIITRMNECGTGI